MRGWCREASALLALSLVSACTVIPQTAPPSRYPAAPSAPVPTPALPSGDAATLGVLPGPRLTTDMLGSGRPAAALRSFVESCRSLLVRTDQSGLTRPSDWRAACEAAPKWAPGDAAAFFTAHFDTARVGDGKSYVTGYYEPEIAGSRTRQPGFDVPVYTVPPDLVRAWPIETPFEQRIGRPPPGRFDAEGRFIAYHDRAAIEDGALAGKGLELAWAADPVEFFFLQIQGSGRLVAPDGSLVRIGYAGQNGLPYTGIGQLMKDRGLIGEGPGQYPGSMQGIMRYMREHPAEGRALMRQNRAYVFFRENAGSAPVGALNVPVRGQVTLAADPYFVPLGAPVWLDTDRAEAGGLWVVQDTGGAIKGANRFDSFWGAGPAARSIAGGMSARGDALILLPKGVVAGLVRTGRR